LHKKASATHSDTTPGKKFMAEVFAVMKSKSILRGRHDRWKKATGFTSEKESRRLIKDFTESTDGQKKI